jgi:hypothetical protein
MRRGRKDLQKRRDALNLRLAGASYRDIAKALGYAEGNPGNVYKMIQSELNAVVREPAKELREMELRRLDQMQQGLWPEARTGDPEAVRTVLRIMEQRARYYGISAPSPQLVLNQHISQQMDTDAVLVVQGDKQSYIKALRAMRGEAEQPALPPPQQELVGVSVNPDLEDAVPVPPGDDALSHPIRDGSIQQPSFPEGEVTESAEPTNIISQ